MSATTFGEIYVVFIVIIGLFGNLYCIRLLRFTKLKNYAFSHYLVALAISDMVFLTTLTCLYVYNLGLDLMNIPVLCQLFYFLSYTSSFLSNWYIAALSFERFLAVYKPFKSYQIAVSSSRFKLQLIVITVCGIGLNCWPLALFEVVPTTQSENNHSVNYTVNVCQFRQSAEKYYKELNMFDLVVSCALPLFIILIFNSLVVRELVCYQKTFWHDETTGKTSEEYHLVPKNLNSRTSRNSSSLIYDNIQRQRRNNERKVTILLLTISLTHFLLNMPCYVYRMILSFVNPIENDKSSEPEESVLEDVVNLFFYTQYSVNFILYSSKRNICRLAKSKFCRK